MKKKITSIAFIFIAFSACQNKPSANENKSIINTTISVADFESKLTTSKDVQLVDVRTTEEFKEGHFEHALNYDFNSKDFTAQLNTLNKTKPVLIYCFSGGRSSAAAEEMAKIGFTEVYNMEGGILKWNAANKPLVNKNASSIMSIEDFNNLLQTKQYVLVDYNATWCLPCKRMAPMLTTYAEKNKEKLLLLKIDADKNKNILQEKGIESIPALELYKNGKLIWKREGEIDEATLQKEIKW